MARCSTGGQGVQQDWCTLSQALLLGWRRQAAPVSNLCPDPRGERWRAPSVGSIARNPKPSKKPRAFQRFHETPAGA